MGGLWVVLHFSFFSAAIGDMTNGQQAEAPEGAAQFNFLK